MKNIIIITALFLFILSEAFGTIKVIMEDYTAEPNRPVKVKLYISSASSGICEYKDKDGDCILNSNGDAIIAEKIDRFKFRIKYKPNQMKIALNNEGEKIVKVVNMPICRDDKKTQFETNITHGTYVENGILWNTITFSGNIRSSDLEKCGYDGILGDRSILEIFFKSEYTIYDNPFSIDVLELKSTIDNEYVDLNYSVENGSVTCKLPLDEDLNNKGCKGNLIGGFTKNLSGWRTWLGRAKGISTFPVDDLNKASVCDVFLGNSALKIPAGYEDGAYYHRSFEYNKNSAASFSLQAYAKYDVPHNLGWAGIGVHYFNESNEYISQQSVGVFDNKWTHIQMELEIPEETRWISVWAYKTEKGTAHFDGICFINHLNCNDNLITKNQGFEYGALNNDERKDNWSRWDRVEIISGTGNTNSGNYAAVVKDGIWGGALHNHIEISPSKNYTLKSYAKQIGVTNRPAIGVEFYNANKEKIDIAGTSVPVTTSYYKQYQYDFTPPENAYYVRPFFWKNSKGTFYVDDFCLVENTSCFEKNRPVCNEVNMPSSTKKKGIIWGHDNYSYLFEEDCTQNCEKDPNLMDELDVGWYFNNAGNPTANYEGNAEYVKNMHRQGDRNNVYSHFCYPSGIAALTEGYMLGYNEPDMTNQADMTVDLAIEHWAHMCEFKGKLGSPCTFEHETTPNGWFERFMEKIECDPELRVDFLQVHYYHHVHDIEHLKNYLHTLWTKYKRPIWITEWMLTPNPGYGYYSMEQQLAFMKEVVPLLERLDYVERYAWYGMYGDRYDKEWVSNLFKPENDELTCLGKAYKTLPGAVPANLVCEQSTRLESTENSLSTDSQSSNLSNIKTSPNPSKGLVNVSLQALENTALKMQVLGVDGKIFLNNIIQVEENTNQFPLDLSHLPNGLYLLKLNDGKHNYAQKIKILH